LEKKSKQESPNKATKVIVLRTNQKRKGVMEIEIDHFNSFNLHFIFFSDSISRIKNQESRKGLIDWLIKMMI
jgi:hypothetical protein